MSTTNCQCNFELHVESVLGIPDIGPDFIQYSAPVIVKLEPGAFNVVSTGVTIAHSKTQGNIHISLVDKYADDIEITSNVYNPYYNKQLTVQLYNKTDNFIRITTNEKLFKYTWVANPVVKSVSVGV